MTRQAHTRRPLPESGPLHLGGDLLIPKVFHRIWFGPMRRFHLLNGERLRQMYEPRGWQVEEWGIDDIGLTFLPTEAIVRALRKKRWSWASDLMRYALIAELGGFYIDSDAEPIAPCEEALRGREFMVVPESGRSLNNCYIAAVPGNPLLVHLLDTLDHRLATAKGAAWEVTGPAWLTDVWHDFADSGITWPLPPRDPFMPYSSTDVCFPMSNGVRSQRAHGMASWPEGTLFVHHWSSERVKPGKRRDPEHSWALDMRLVP